jgi:hypothetical protein
VTLRGEGEKGVEIFRGTLAWLMAAPWRWTRVGFVRASFCRRESRRAGVGRHVSTVTLFGEVVKRELLWRMRVIDDECREKKKRLYHRENQREHGAHEGNPPEIRAADRKIRLGLQILERRIWSRCWRGE